MSKSVGLAFALSVISLVIGFGDIGQSLAKESQGQGTTDTSLSKSASREGGQSGRSSHLEKRPEAAPSRGESRIGGQSGMESPLEERASSYGSMGGKRVGGQSGVERDEGKSLGKVK
jgi:hypothetical protein